jgi:hypothetical protein
VYKSKPFLGAWLELVGGILVTLGALLVWLACTLTNQAIDQSERWSTR